MSNTGKIGACALALAAMGTLAAPALAMQQEKTDLNIVVTAEHAVDTAQLPAGPEIKGTITARNANRIKLTAADGTSTIVTINEATKIKAGSSLFGKGAAPGPEALLNGLPVTVKTLQAGSGLIASQISFKSGDLKTAMMIRNGTAQQFEAQTAATEEVRQRAEALRSRMADIDKYNIKSTTNVFFDSGKAVLSPQAKTDLCTAASGAEAMDNALLLVVGYTDSTGSDEVNQALSEKRAGSVINYLQQACHWKPWRVLTPTGMATADPLASNDTPEGKAQNRRVAVNVLVSKSVDGM